MVEGSGFQPRLLQGQIHGRGDPLQHIRQLIWGDASKEAFQVDGIRGGELSAIPNQSVAPGVVTGETGSRRCRARSVRSQT
ncbi:hypothetical protein KQ306_01620 [Synechococcus sp. CS-1324]|uniref:hypothetical protein n=1 Tax=Synechococcus sp. CS-1324 TaxID=2847980 RepID=UPI000DAFB4BD|nr:hypothetical protein [Synechococcus sp. CS-1324]MCT0229563.1 hypothetical protein [Synechococcus sp. CS-1324]PZV03182.1 MAG: hypothetical protein DCF23_10350 [Cyanobium sp.]